jgi:integrase
MADKWQTVAQGVRVKTHPTRKHGKGPDKYFVIRYTLDGKMVTEPLGWASQGMTQAEAVSRRLNYIKAIKGVVEGVRSKSERDELEKKCKEEEVAEADRKAKALITLSEYWPNYKSYAKMKKGEKTFATEQGHFLNWIEQVLGDVPIAEIGLEEWDKLMAVLGDCMLTSRTKQHIACTLRQILKHAKKRGVVKMSPPSAEDVGAVLKKNSNRRTRELTDIEINEIFTMLAVQDLCAYRVSYFAATACCRFGEAGRLEWKDVDFVNKEVIFRKTKNSDERRIPLTEPIADFLKSFAKDEGLVFPNNNGTKYKQSATPYFTVVRKLGLNEGRNRLDKVVFHTLRHTGATRLSRANKSLRILMDYGGWKTAESALRYQHSDWEDLQGAADTLTSIIPRIEPEEEGF